jgi:two-component system KDP operon response regulator KdpE
MADQGVTSGRILIIEDELEFRRTYERLLRRMHYEVVTAEEGAEALRIAGSQPVHLVVTDLSLPNTDGIALIRALRAGASRPPIIVVSGQTSPASRRAALEAGATAYLTKPFSVSELIALIQQILRASSGKAP